jgi:RNA polymerase sigma factor (sigma-70 family)
VIKQIKRLDSVITGCIAGDEKCKEWLYRSYYGYLKAVARRYIDNASDLEELVNDSFVKIFKHLNRFGITDDPIVLSRSFKGWAAKITSRTAIDFLRVDKNYFRVEELTDDSVDAEPVSITDKMNVQDILALLNSLPALQKVIFNMYEIEGYSHEEIAESLQIPYANSRVYLARAKKTLRTLYQKSINSISYAS